MSPCSPKFSPWSDVMIRTVSSRIADDSRNLEKPFQAGIQVGHVTAVNPAGVHLRRGQGAGGQEVQLGRGVDRPRAVAGATRRRTAGRIPSGADPERWAAMRLTNAKNGAESVWRDPPGSSVRGRPACPPCIPRSVYIRRNGPMLFRPRPGRGPRVHRERARRSFGIRGRNRC